MSSVHLPPDSFLGHLEVLRFVLLKCIGIFALLFLPGWYFAPFMREWLLDFAAPEGFKLHYFTLMEPFFVQMKIAAFSALTAGLPAYLWIIWRFVAPGLHPHERVSVRIPLLLALLLAAAGVATGIFFITPAVVQFSLSFASQGMEPVIGIDGFLSFILLVSLAGALLFQFPLLLSALLAAGIVKLETLQKQRGTVLVILLVISAVVTPPDVISQLLLAIPAYLLFEASLLYGRIIRKRGVEGESVRR